MRSALLSGLGEDDQPGVLKPCALQYFRQHLQKSSAGAQRRELLTIAATADLLLTGKAASAMDLLLQRFKSCEAVTNGTHWSVAQRLELLPQEGVSLTPVPEMDAAQKDIYAESRMKWLASQPDGRSAATGFNRSGGKGKGESRDDGHKGSGKDR